MTFDFDTQLALRGTHCTKHDAMAKTFGLDAPDAIPMWVADMEFPAAPPILDALKSEVDRGYMGYFGDSAPVAQAVADWLSSRHGLSIDTAKLRWTRGVIEGLALTLEALSDPGDAVIVFSPVYHAFFRKVEAMGRTVLESPLRVDDGRHVMDLEALQAALKGREKIVILCSPHNPGGRLWSGEEIRSLTEFCARNDMWLISDEIHMDLTFPGAEHVPTLRAVPEAADRTIVLSAASKGFNVAGAETAFAYLPNDELRARFDTAQSAYGGTPNRFGMVMLKAAFTDGRAWSDACCAYLAENFRIWRQRIGALPGVSVMDMQATYLSWVNFTDTGLTEAELSDRIIGQARIAPSPGTQFRHGGALHRRFNLAMPRSTLMTAIERIETAFGDLQ